MRLNHSGPAGLAQEAVGSGWSAAPGEGAQQVLSEPWVWREWECGDRSAETASGLSHLGDRQREERRA